MAVLRSGKPKCPAQNRHCSEWARIHMKYCLCNVNDGVSLTLGLFSVISWGVAEIPQIITNYKEKSTEGLSIAFLMTWIAGDLFNVFGCMLEPATLPTQYYMAMLYTLTTMILTTQAIYYGHIYQLKCNRERQKIGKSRSIDDADSDIPSVDKWQNSSNTFDTTNILSSPIPFPRCPHISSSGGELYYTSARSLSRSHTPTTGSFLAQRLTPPIFHIKDSVEEPLLGGVVSTQSAPALNTKTMLCLVSLVTFFGTVNLHHPANNRLNVIFENKSQVFVKQLGPKILQENGGMSLGTNTAATNSIGTFLGWAMAAIYMGGRLPQICLNIKRGNVEGLNPLMFIFALVGNVTYVASILVSSLEWSHIRPNLPWLVDAAGCVLLDTFILLQFVHFRYRTSPKEEGKPQKSPCS